MIKLLIEIECIIMEVKHEKLRMGFKKENG